MRSKEHDSKTTVTRGQHLRLISTSPRADIPAQAAPEIELQPDTATVKQLTHAMMNRLWIPQTNTIVGLLDVGLSRTNFDELSKWITHQLATVPEGGAANELPQLEKRFRRTLDRFPEL